MVTNRALEYQRNQVQTASPEELTFMLYNGLVKFIKQGKKEIENKQIEQANNYVIRAQDILSELMLTLNMDYEISKQLMPLYDYMKNGLVQANLQKDLEKLLEIEEMAVELKETWAQAMKIAKKTAGT
ncbi:flagellar export chaperone FliS [Ammoniphilus resinae]|uniref:Flagellar secretion chaperone FliS n=1 Tax=Ammoniphilus resinae TaxID=861532 RepID=A0ABS4GN21_9BACL|nr:flagellar export chaperone FliS [Ammoniphilus resinae]MBP1931512.1 flagellar protein FliS [Ammoniphilus resinae]